MTTKHFRKHFRVKDKGKNDRKKLIWKKQRQNRIRKNTWRKKSKRFMEQECLENKNLFELKTIKTEG